MECLNFKTVIRRGVGYALELIDNGATRTFDVDELPRAQRRRRPREKEGRGSNWAGCQKGDRARQELQGQASDEEWSDQRTAS